jgi:predicted transcriptional regulator
MGVERLWYAGGEERKWLTEWKEKGWGKGRPSLKAFPFTGTINTVMS